MMINRETTTITIKLKNSHRSQEIVDVRCNNYIDCICNKDLTELLSLDSNKTQTKPEKQALEERDLKRRDHLNNTKHSRATSSLTTTRTCDRKYAQNKQFELNFVNFFCRHNQLEISAERPTRSGLHVQGLRTCNFIADNV